MLILFDFYAAPIRRRVRSLAAHAARANGDGAPGCQQRADYSPAAERDTCALENLDAAAERYATAAATKSDTEANLYRAANCDSLYITDTETRDPAHEWCTCAEAAPAPGAASRRGSGGRVD